MYSFKLLHLKLKTAINTQTMHFEIYIHNNNNNKLLRIKLFRRPNQNFCINRQFQYYLLNLQLVMKNMHCKSQLLCRGLPLLITKPEGDSNQTLPGTTVPIIWDAEMMLVSSFILPLPPNVFQKVKRSPIQLLTIMYIAFCAKANHPTNGVITCFCNEDV